MAKATEPTETQEPEERPEKVARDDPWAQGYIRYIGTSTERGLLVADFESVGVSDQHEDVWWRRSNNWTVPRSILSKAAYEQAVRMDPELILIGGDEEEGSTPVPQQGEERMPIASQMTEMPPAPEPGEFVGGMSAVTGGTSAGGTRGGTGAGPQ